MPLKNLEIKARCADPDIIRGILEKQNADFTGTDHQIDTYFKIDERRLKLREGTIENNLIYYHRPDTKSPKRSDIHLVPMQHPEKMKALLTAALGIQITVDKQREIYFIDNVKFHIDDVQQLGSFIEIEAIDKDGSFGESKLRQQCAHYMGLFSISEDDLVAQSYSDLLTKRNG